MPNFGKKSGGGFKPSSSNKGAARKASIQQSLSQRGARPSRRRQGFDEDDLPLSPEVEAEDELDTQRQVASVEVATPFTDGIVSRQFKGLVVIPKVGGEECSILADFLSVFSRTEPFFGSINQKTSYMKKTGGRLL